MAQTLVEKIAQRFGVEVPASQEVRVGDFLSIRPYHVMTHDNTAAVIPKFRSMGATQVLDPAQPVYALDHDIQNTTPENLAKYASIESFAKEQGVAFYPAGRGIGHQVMLEEGYVLPGTFVVASDSHSNIYGALGALGTPVVRTDAAAIWATGKTWWQVPDVVKVVLHGELPVGASGKDVIITLIGVFNQDEVLNCCLEFVGPGVASLDMAARMAISNMTTEWGALAGLFPADETTRAYLLERAQVMADRGDAAPRLTPAMVEEAMRNAPAADADAVYTKVLEFDLNQVTPFVAGPNEVKTITSLPEMEAREVRIDKAFLMSCVNGRLPDFEAAAAIIKGQQVAPHVKFYVAAASSEVETQAKERGYWQTLMDAGAIALPAGCGACIGLGEGVLESGEVGISATNRNFKGRMGAADAKVYLASPEVVAASAIVGRVASPIKVGAAADAPGAAGGTTVPSQEALRSASKITIPPKAPAAVGAVELIDGFPARLEGELLLIPKDNLNTDGIYGKEYTYKEGMSPEEMAAVAMANYDPGFQQIAREGDILVGGYTFGSGSSREQAATALKYRGLRMVIAGSFSQTYKRNAFNNGYIVIECPELVDDLRTAHAASTELTIRTGAQAVVDFTTATIGCANKEYRFAPLGSIAQQLIVKGGFEALLREEVAELNKG
jgi:homoaconitate hydratase